MKLAEALQERADLNRRIDQLSVRLRSNAIVQEGESPAEDPAGLMEELDGCIERLSELMKRINRTNCLTESGGKTLTDMIAERDCLKLKIASYRLFADEASQTGQRARMTEIKLLRTADVPGLRKMIDSMSRDLRELDNTIQGLNWTVELM